MAIIEFRGDPLNRIKLQKWSKDKLISELLSALEFLDAKEKKRQEYENIVRIFAEKFETQKWQYARSRAPKDVPIEKWFDFLDRNRVTPKINLGHFRKAWETINGKIL